MQREEKRDGGRVSCAGSVTFNRPCPGGLGANDVRFCAVQSVLLGIWAWVWVCTLDVPTSASVKVRLCAFQLSQSGRRESQSHP